MLATDLILMSASEMLEELLNGNIWVILQPYINIFGSYFYAMLAFMVLGVMYVRTESPAAVAIAAIAMFIPAVTIMPVEFHKVGYIVVALGLAASIFKVFYGRVPD